MPRFGYVLEGEQAIVGVLLLISSRRPDGRIVANLSSWYVEPAWRAHSTLLVSMTTKNKRVTYLNASPRAAHLAHSDGAGLPAIQSGPQRRVSRGWMGRRSCQ